MRYADFEHRIVRMAASASESARRSFAIDTITRLFAGAAGPLSLQLTPDEHNLAQRLAEGFADGDLQSLKDMLNRLSDSMTLDEVRAIEFDPAITEWMSAIDNWIGYRQSGDPKAIAGVAINLVNAIDYEIEGRAEGYSIDNILGAQAMRVEYERQQRMLEPPDGEP
jgi:hypothetical protein